MMDYSKIERFNRELDSLLQNRALSVRGLSSEDRRALELARLLNGLDPSSQSRARQRLRWRLQGQSRQLRQRSPLSKLFAAHGSVAILILAVLAVWIIGNIA